MALLREDAERLSNNKLISGVIEEIINRDAIYALLPWVGTNNKAYVYNREKTLPTINFYNPNEAIGEGTGTTETVTVLLKIMAHNVDVDKFLSGTMNDTNNQVAIQLQFAAKAVDMKFRDVMINGDSVAAPKTFDGMKKLVTDKQTIYAGANGGSLTFDQLDELIHMVPNRPDCLFMNFATYRALRALMRDLSSVQPDMLKVKDFDRALPSYDGIPILLSDFIASNETRGTATSTTSVYAARMNTVDGLHGIYGDPTAGVVVENIGTREDYDANRWRLKWYVSMALKSTRSLARLAGITN
jgi:hypothetical protein